MTCTAPDPTAAYLNAEKRANSLQRWRTGLPIPGRMLLISTLVASLSSFVQPLNAQTPTVQLTNVTRGGSSTFIVGDQWRIDVTGPAYQDVRGCASQNGLLPMSCTVFGQTNGGVVEWAESRLLAGQGVEAGQRGRVFAGSRVDYNRIRGVGLGGCCLLLSITAAPPQYDGFDLVLLLDVSQQMADPAAFVVAGARLAMFELSPNDRAAVISVSSGAKIQTGFTSDTGQLERALKKANRTIIRTSNERRLYDAIDLAVEQFAATPDPNRRRAVVVITNDVDRGSRRGRDDLIREARARGVAIWLFLIASPYPGPSQRTIGDPGISYPDVRFAAQQLQPIAGQTGGEVSIRDPNGYVLRQAIAACKNK